MIKKVFAVFNKIKNVFKPQINYQDKTLHDVLSDQLYTVDQLTSADLLISDFIAQYDNTKTSCGSYLFQHWLLSIKNKEQIKSLQSDMSQISDPSAEVIKNTLEKKAGKQITGNFIRDLWNGFSIKSWLIDNFYILFFLNIALSVTLSILLPKYIFLFVLLFFFINFIFFILTNACISHVSSSIGYFLSLCQALKKIDKNVNLNLSIKTPDYRKFNRLIKYSLFFKEGIGGPSSGDIISILLDYIRIFFAMELYSFKRTEGFIRKNIQQVREIYIYSGYLDCLTNNIKIFSENNCCMTDFNSQTKINFQNLRHPLIQNSIPQTKNINQNMIITGLNMSGKTTFMKSLALNQILATSFGFCFADSYSTNIFHVISSIKINDDLLGGKSRYYAEAERLLEIKKMIKDHQCLCLIDEILSGTNSEERIYGSTIILKDFQNDTSMIIAATHDIQIARNLKDTYTPIYFDGDIEGNKIKFDYKIKDGIVSKKNGLLLLKLLGVNSL